MKTLWRRRSWLKAELFAVTWFGGFVLSAQTTTSETEELLSETERGIAEIGLINSGLAGAENTSPAAAGSLVPKGPGSSESLPLPRQAVEGIMTPEQATEAWEQQNWLLAGLRDLELEGREQEGEASPSGSAFTGSAKPPETSRWVDASVRRTPSADERFGPALDDSLAELSNPLDAFMADWMTPGGRRLHALTQDLATAGAVGEGQARVSWDESEEERDLPIGSMRSSISATNPIEPRETERINPYVEALISARTASSISRLDETPVVTGALSTIEDTSSTAPAIRDDREVEQPPAPRNESWRPPEKTDEKYFRNLNRF